MRLQNKISLFKHRWNASSHSTVQTGPLLCYFVTIISAECKVDGNARFHARARFFVRSLGHFLNSKASRVRHDVDNRVSKTSRLRELRIFRFVRWFVLKLMYIFIGWNLENTRCSTYDLLFFILTTTNMQIVFRKLQYCDVLKKREAKCKIEETINRWYQKGNIFKFVFVQQQVEAYSETLTYKIYVTSTRYGNRSCTKF